MVVTPGSTDDWVRLKANRSGELCFVVNDVVPDQEQFYVNNDPSRYRDRVETLKQIARLFRGNDQEVLEMTPEVSREVGEYLGRFIGHPPRTPEEYVAQKQQHWRKLKDSGYLGIFHDDNSGSYLITIRKRTT